MSSSDGTASSQSQSLDFPQDSSASEDDTNGKLRTDINDLIVAYGRELFLDCNSNILPDLSNTLSQVEDKDETFSFDVKEKVFPDELKKQVQSLIGEYGQELYEKMVKRACIDHPNLSFQMNDIVLDDRQKRKRKEYTASHESDSLLATYDSLGETEAPSQGSANREVIPCFSPIILSGNDEDEFKRVKKTMRVEEGKLSLHQSQEPSLTDGLTQTIKNIHAKRRIDYSSGDHGVKGQEKEKKKEEKSEEDKTNEEENDDSVQENESSAENKIEDD